MKNINSSKKVFECFRKVAATAISGHRVVDRFQIWVGPGGNGKDISKIAFKSVFGIYFYKENGGMFASRSVGSSPSSECNLAKFKVKRVCMQSECESGDKLHIGLLKQCSSNDTVSARALYQDAGSFECKAIIFLLYNEIPACDEADNDGFCEAIGDFFSSV